MTIRKEEKQLEKYMKISDWMTGRGYRYGLFRLLYYGSPMLIFLGYGILLLYGMMELPLCELARIVTVPAITFAVTSLFRKCINCRRPYEVYDITPLIEKNKAGESFPSRHMVSAVIITAAGYYVDALAGLLLLIPTIIVGIVRPVAGVHFVRDILGAVVIGMVFGIIGFAII